MSNPQKTQLANLIFHRTVGKSNRLDWARYRLLRFFFLFSKSIAKIIPGKERYLAWKELTLKIQAFILFEHINISIKFDPKSDISLEESVELVRKRISEPENQLWASEGLGYLFAEREFLLERKERVTGFLQNKNLPRQSLGILHSGMGMLYATWFLKNFNNKNLFSNSNLALEQYLKIIKENSVPGYAEIPVESLGFIARLQYPEEVLVINKILHDINEDYVSYFWHGVGRALAFLPSNLWPGSSFPWKAIKMATKESPHELGKLNVLSGLGWPLTLVNIREPKIMEGVLKYHGEFLLKNDAFSNGVSSALVFLQEFITDKTLINSFYNHKPDTSNESLQEIWDQCIKIPCERVFKEVYPYLKKENCWAELLKYTEYS